MKAKLTLTVDEELIPIAKRCAEAQGISLSQVVEDALRSMTHTDSTRGSFSQRWRGTLTAVEKPTARYKALAKRYL